MEVAGYVSHNTAFIRSCDVAQVRYFEQLLEVALRTRAVAATESRNAPVCRDDRRPLGMRVECYRVGQTSKRSGFDSDLYGCDGPYLACRSRASQVGGHGSMRIYGATS